MLLKDKKFYRMFLVLCLPIVLQNVISLSVNLTDNLMLGSYAESALSGVTAVNQIQFIYQNLLIGIGDGLVILASQYWGKKTRRPFARSQALPCARRSCSCLCCLSSCRCFRSRQSACLPMTRRLSPRASSI